MGSGVSLDQIAAHCEEEGVLVKYLLDSSFTHVVIAGFVDAFKRDPRKIRGLVDNIRLEMNASLSRKQDQRRKDEAEGSPMPYVQRKASETREEPPPDTYVRSSELDEAKSEIAALKFEVAELRQNMLLGERIPDSLVVCQAKAARDAAMMHELQAAELTKQAEQVEEALKVRQYHRLRGEPWFAIQNLQPLEQSRDNLLGAAKILAQHARSEKAVFDGARGAAKRALLSEELEQHQQQWDTLAVVDSGAAAVEAEEVRKLLRKVQLVATAPTQEPPGAESAYTNPAAKGKNNEGDDDNDDKDEDEDDDDGSGQRKGGGGGRMSGEGEQEAASVGATFGSMRRRMEQMLIHERENGPDTSLPGGRRAVEGGDWLHASQLVGAGDNPYSLVYLRRLYREAEQVSGLQVQAVQTVFSIHTMFDLLWLTASTLCTWIPSTRWRERGGWRSCCGG
jgi:hypothetical protein